MKRLRRILLNTATAISLLLFLAGVYIWIRGYIVSDSIYRSVWSYDGKSAHETAYWLFSSRGQVGIGQRLQEFKLDERQVERYGHLLGKPDFAWKCNTPPEPLLNDRKGNGFLRSLGFSRMDESDKGGYRQWIAPLWFICFLTAALPAYWLARYKSRRRYPPGHCSRCGYDLRATPDRCPECGYTT